MPVGVTLLHIDLLMWSSVTPTGWLVPRPQETRAKHSEPPMVIGPHHAKRLDPIAPVRDALHAKELTK